MIALIAGAIVGNDDVFDAVVRRAGPLREPQLYGFVGGGEGRVACRAWVMTARSTGFHGSM